MTLPIRHDSSAGRDSTAGQDSSAAEDGPLYGLDIETDTTVDGLDPGVAAVVAVAVSGPGVEQVLLGPEPELLARLDDVVRSLPPGYLVTWNGSGFDLPFLAERSRITATPLGLRLAAEPIRAVPDGGHPPTVRVRATWHGHRHLDGYRVYRADVGRSLGLSCGLKPLARLVGLRPVEVDRERMHDLGPDELRDYVLSDARLARELVLRRWPAARVWADPVDRPTAGPD
jgi:hypothetical protein